MSVFSSVRGPPISDKARETNEAPISQYLPARQFMCEKHSEMITNFSVNTLQPLCPECVSEISSVEGSLHSHVIDTFKNVKANCSKKIKTGIFELTRTIENSEIQYLVQPDLIMEEGRVEIVKTKQALLKIIDAHFDAVFASFQSQVEKNTMKASGLITIFQNIRESIFELETLSSKLDQGDTIDAIKRVCSIDLKQLITTYNEDMHGVVDSRDLDPIRIAVNESVLTELKTRILPQIVQIKKIHSHSHEKVLPSVSQTQPKLSIAQPDSILGTTNQKANPSFFQQQTIKQSAQYQQQQQQSQVGRTDLMKYFDGNQQNRQQQHDLSNQQVQQQQQVLSSQRNPNSRLNQF